MATSAFQLFLSVENHVDDISQQLKMGHIFQETFGEKLHYMKSGDTEKLPSPDALKGRILVEVEVCRALLRVGKFFFQTRL